MSMTRNVDPRELQEESLEPNHAPNLLDVQEDGSSAICNIVGIAESGNLGNLFVENSVAIELAIRHLNTGNSSLVPQLSELRETCPITFSSYFVPTQGGHSQLFQMADFSTRLKESTDSVEEQTTMNLFNRTLPCAFIGGTKSVNTQISSLVTGMRGYPQISYSATSVSLNNRDDYPLFGRTVPDDESAGAAFIRFLHDNLNVRHFFVIFDSDPFSRSVHESMRNAIIDFGWGEEGKKVQKDETMYMASHLLETVGDQSNRKAIDALIKKKYRYVVALIATSHDVHKLMEIASEKNAAGNGMHHWWFSDAFSLSRRSFSKDSVTDSNLAKAYSGVGSFRASPPTDGDKYAAYLDQSREIKEELYGELRSRVVGNNTLVLKGGKGSPFTQDVQVESFDARTFFDQVYDSIVPAFSYDATILLGLSACREVIESRGKEEQSALVLKGEDFYRQITQTSFSGVTGNVTLNGQNESGTGSRNGHSIRYVIENWLAVDEGDNNTSNVRFEPTISHHYAGGGDGWKKIATYVYNGGNESTPPDLPAVDLKVDKAGEWIKYIGFVLTAIILSMTTGFAIWTWQNRKKRVIQASQPVFLLLLCSGIAVMACAMIPTSLELTDVDHPMFVCHAQLWLFVLGFGITFSTLFAKTYRINRIMSSARKFKRIKLTTKDTIYPVGIIYGFNIIMLSLTTKYGSINARTHVSKDDEFGRPEEQYTRCFYGESTPFLVTIFVVNLVMVCLAIIQAWRARNLSTEFAESTYIASSLVICFTASILAFPILLLVGDNVAVVTFVVTVLIFIITTSTLCCIFVPKVLFCFLDKQTESTFGTHVYGTASTARYSTSTARYSTSRGERILTSKPQEKLLSEIKTLEQQLASVTKQVEILKLQNTDLEEGMKNDVVPPLRTSNSSAQSITAQSITAQSITLSSTRSTLIRESSKEFGFIAKRLQFLCDSYADKVCVLAQEDFADIDTTGVAETEDELQNGSVRRVKISWAEGESVSPEERAKVAQ